MINHPNIIRRWRRPRSGVDASLTAAVRGLSRSRLKTSRKRWVPPRDSRIKPVSPTLHGDHVRQPRRSGPQASRVSSQTFLKARYRLVSPALLARADEEIE